MRIGPGGDSSSTTQHMGWSKVTVQRLEGMVCKGDSPYYDCEIEREELSEFRNRSPPTQQLNFSRQTRYFYLVGKLPFASPVLVPSTAVPKLPRSVTSTR